MNKHLIGDGFFMVKEEEGRTIITLCAWTKQIELEIIRLLDNRKDTEIHINNNGYIYGEERPEIALTLTKI
jgi:hypothetical protein